MRGTPDEERSPRAIPGIGSHTNSGEALTVYSDWLRGGQTTDSSAYHLWSDRDLYGCPKDDPFPCPGKENNGVLGGAFGDRAVFAPGAANRFQQGGAVSIMEGVDIRTGDTYNGNDNWDRARVGGHELTHTYGEGANPSVGDGFGHHDHCKNSNNCNIMRPGFSDAVQTYWIDWSRCEVYRWYFHGDDQYGGAPEPCPNWYQP